MISRLRRWLDHPRWPWMAAVLGVVLALPGLRIGLFGDDYVQRIIILGTRAGAESVPPSERPLSELFAFTGTGTALSERWAELGLSPWWHAPELRLAFLRPLSAVTHVLDYRLWPEAIWLHHAQSLLWYGALVLVIALVFRRVHGLSRVAALAALIFAVEDAHAMPAVWLANRNALIALFFGGLGLIFHLRWRADRRTMDLVAALAMITLGLASGEAGLGVLAYVVAWQLTMDRGSLARRFLALSPYLALVVAWRAVYVALGHGVRDSGLYIDPAQHPGRFLAALAERAPLLLAGQWLQLPIDLWSFLPREVQLIASLGSAVVVVALALVFRGTLRRRREARFWATGMVLALVPLCASFPMDRLLLFASVGAAGLLACQAEELGWLGEGEASTARTKAIKVAVAALLILHIPLAAALLAARSAIGMSHMGPVEQAIEMLPTTPEISDQTVVFVHGHDLFILAMASIRMVDGGPLPRRFLQLGSVMTPLEVLRVDERTLELRQEGGMLRHPFDCLARDPNLAFSQGQIFRMSDATIELVELTSDGRPLGLQVRFGLPLEHPSLRWMRFRKDGIYPWTPPAIGERETLRLDLW